jgi:hypothetical protein
VIDVAFDVVVTDDGVIDGIIAGAVGFLFLRIIFVCVFVCQGMQSCTHRDRFLFLFVQASKQCKNEKGMSAHTLKRGENKLFLLVLTKYEWLKPIK